jgi:exportin-2 (importin alpha re-exporter)
MSLVSDVDLASLAGRRSFESYSHFPFSLNLTTEFVPFVFQILSQMLELHNGEQIPPSYTALLPSLLTPALWQTRSNVPALVRLLQAFLAKGSNQIVTTSTLQSLLGIYQQLIASRVNDEFGFELLLSIFQYVSR